MRLSGGIIVFSFGEWVGGGAGGEDLPTVRTARTKRPTQKIQRLCVQHSKRTVRHEDAGENHDNTLGFRFLWPRFE